MTAHSIIVRLNQLENNKMRIIPNSLDLVIRNLDALPHGTGARYLVVIEGQDNEYVAKRWTRVPKCTNWELLIDLGGDHESLHRNYWLLQ